MPADSPEPLLLELDAAVGAGLEDLGSCPGRGLLAAEAEELNGLDGEAEPLPATPEALPPPFAPDAEPPPLLFELAPPPDGAPVPLFAEEPPPDLF